MRIDDDHLLYYTRRMAMGKSKRVRQPGMWVTTTDLPTAASHPFYRRLNQLLREHGFDDFAEAQCAGFYAETMGRPGLPPGVYFRLISSSLHPRAVALLRTDVGSRDLVTEPSWSAISN